MKIILSAFFILIVSSCTSLQSYEERQKKFSETINTWVGSSDGDLIKIWGVPTNVYRTGDTKYLTYRNSRTSVDSSLSPCFTEYCYPTIDTNVVNYSCEITFTVINQKITTWRAKGNNCF